MMYKQTARKATTGIFPLHRCVWRIPGHFTMRRMIYRFYSTVPNRSKANTVSNAPWRQCLMSLTLTASSAKEQEAQLLRRKLFHALNFSFFEQHNCAENYKSEKVVFNKIFLLQNNTHERALLFICRVIGSLQNFQKFSKTFNCPVGSFMNPVKKCVVW